MENPQSRALSRHERFSLVRDHIGSVPALTYIASFRAGASVPDISRLNSRLALLVQHHPILACRVADSLTKHPRLEHFSLDDGAIKERLSSRTLRIASGKTPQQTIFEECLSWHRTMHVETGDLWRLAIFTDEASNQSYIAGSVHHVLTDAKGFLPLLCQLLSTDDLSLDSTAKSLPPALEDGVNIKPSLTALLSVIIKALLVPKLPTWLVPSFLRTIPHWPYTSRSGDPGALSSDISPLKADIGILTGSWSAQSVLQLREYFAGGATKAASVQTIFCACAIAALWITEKRSEPDGVARSLDIKIETPTSERNSKHGHPNMLGNYVGSVTQQMGISGDMTLQDIARSYGAHISNRGVRQAAATVWGLLDFIDDPEVSNIETGSAITGWEKFFLDQATGTQPLSASLEVSNIGVLPVLPVALQSDLHSFDWMQVPHPMGPAICFNVIGLQPDDIQQRFGKLTFSTTWRVDAAPEGRLSRGRMEHLVNTIQQLPLRVEQMEASGRPTTLNELLEV